MPRTLIVVAGAGLTISFVCLSLASALGGGGVGPGWFFNGCEAFDTKATGGNSREFTWDGDDEVTINVPASVHYRPDGGPTLIASGPPEVLRHLRVSNGRVAYDCRESGFDRALTLTLPGRPLQKFTLNGSSNLMLEDINQPELKIRIRGKGAVRATGTAKNVDVSIAGSGEVHLGELAVQNLDIRIAGSGEGEVAPQEQADIHIAGSGKIRLLTQPHTLNTHIAGSGRIVNAPPSSSAR